jgi:hypothetical protein
MEEFALFQRHVNAIHAAARIVIATRRSAAHWPNLTLTDAGDEGWRVAFSEPVILWDAPIRASTSSGAAAKRAIVMDGSFYFKNGTFDKGGASLEIYSIARSHHRCGLKLLDAMHFDIEPHSRQTPFHPMFHVQSGKNNRWDIAQLQSCVASLARVANDKVDIDRDLNTPTRDLRIPTPQMDYLSMLVMVIADCFCEKNSTHEVQSGFKNLLRKVMDSKNTARNGRQSRRLEQRWADPVAYPFCASHWYEESC